MSSPSEMLIERTPQLAIAFTELPQEEEVKLRSLEFREYLGRQAIHGEVEIETELREQTPDDRSTSLMDAIHRGAWGDQQAKLLVRANVLPDGIERTEKVGYVFNTRLRVTDDGKIIQHGQTTEDVVRNSLLFANGCPKMEPRLSAETNNHFRQQAALDQGLLLDNYFVVLSRIPDNMNHEEQDEVGFFSLTQTWIMQATTQTSASELILSSALMAGVAEESGNNHDEQTVIKLGDALGVDYSNMSAAEIIDRPLLISKSLMPNGVIDLVRLADQLTGDVFFGRRSCRTDYLEFLDECRTREESFIEVADEITDELIARADEIHSPTQATKMLAKLSEKRMVKRAVNDNQIDPRVFGMKAASYIEQARYYTGVGEAKQAEVYTSKAQATAKSSSCPSVYSNPAETENNPSTNKETESNKGKIRCINCRQYVLKADVVKKDCWKCPRCKYAVDICTGKVLNQGQESSSAEPPTENQTKSSDQNKTASSRSESRDLALVA